MSNVSNLYSSNNRFAGLLSNATEHAEFFILGLACSIVNDPRTASFIDDDHHLQTWEGDSSATVDRFDCRLLLDSLGQLRPRAAGNKSNSIVDEEERLADELWTERFCDLEELAMQKEAEEKRAESKIRRRRDDWLYCDNSTVNTRLTILQTPSKVKL
jgi:hypothetical protein